MASTTAGQHQQPVTIRGFEVGINPSILSSSSNGTSLDSLHQQQQQLLYQQSLFAHATSNGHAHGHTRRQSSSSSSSAAAAFMIPHVHAYGGGSGVTTDELVDGLQQSMASMDAHHHQSTSSSHPRASSTSSNSSSNHGGHGNANGGGVSSSNSNKPFEAVARSPTYNWHGYRPGSSGTTSSNNPANTATTTTTSTSPFGSFHSLPPNLTRHVSSPSSYFAAAASSTTINGGHHSQHRSPLDIFPSPSVASTLQLNPHGPASITTESSTPSAFGNYPFNDASFNGHNNNSFDGRLSSFHRHQAHAQSNSYSSAFSPSSFLVNGLNSPTNTTTTSNLNPSSHQASSFNPALSTQHPQSSQKQQQQQQQSQKQAPQTKSPPLFDASSSASNNTDALQQGLNANNKRPGSTDSGHASMNGRGRTDSPNEEAKGASQQQQSRGRSQGRTPASGKAPSARSSRSRTRRPSYSRNISPAGLKNGNTSPSATTGSNAAANPATSINGTNIPTSQSSYSNPYAPQLSPYMPGYPSLPSGHVDQILASQPTSSNNELAFQQHAYGASAPTLSSAGLDFMKLNEHAQVLAQAHLLALHNQQQKQQQQQQQGQTNQQNQSQNNQTPVAPPSRPASTFDILQASELNRRASNASTVGGGGGGGGAPTLSNQATNDLLNSPAAFTGPLPLPHQEGFRTFGSLPAYLSALNGSVAGDGNKESEAGDAVDMEVTTRGRPAADDKRRKRRESHNAVERRRRDNINDRITELAALIPEALLDTAAMQGKPSASRSRSRNGRGDRDESPDTSMQNDMQSDAPPGFPVSSVQFTPAQLAQQAAANRPNKGIILTKSVDYIRYLQQLVQMQAERNRELEIRVRMLESGGAAMIASSGGLPAGFGALAGLGNGSSGAGVGIPSSTNGLVGSPGIPLSAGGNNRSLPPLEEGENAMDEGTGLSHKRDQFTARRSASRNSMNASDLQSSKRQGANGSTTSLVGAGGSQARTSPPELSPQQDLLTTQDWIDNGFADMSSNANKNTNEQRHQHYQHNTNGNDNSATLDNTAMMNMMMMHQEDDNNNHQMTFEDLLQVGRNNRVVSEGRDSFASESPLPSVGKMEEDEDNALGMRL